MFRSFINPDITVEYEPLSGSAHLIVTAGGNIDHIDINQTAALEHCQIENLLPIKEFDCIQLKIRYDVSHKISLADDVFSRRKIIRREFIELVVGIINTVEEISSYNTLTNAGLLYDARYIFVDSVSLNPAMVYLPIYKNIADLSGFRDFVRSLFAYLKLDDTQDDFSTIILDNINKEPFMLRAFKEVILSFKRHEESQKNTVPENPFKPVATEVKPVVPPPPVPDNSLKGPEITPVTLIIFTATNVAMALIVVLLIFSGVFRTSNGTGIDFFNIAAVLAVFAGVELIAVKALRGNKKDKETIKTISQPMPPLKQPEAWENRVPDYDVNDEAIGKTVDDTEINTNPDGLGWGRAEYPYLEYIINGSPIKIYIDKKSFILGRDPAECDYVCTDDEVSRKHAEVITRGSDLYIKEIKARNHTYLSKAGQNTLIPLKLNPGEEYRLFANDMIWLGKNTAFTVKLSFMR